MTAVLLGWRPASQPASQARRAAGRDAVHQLLQEPSTRAECRALVVDTASRASIDALAREVQRQGLALRAVVNNAAVQTPGWSQRDFDEGLATNFEGCAHLPARVQALGESLNAHRCVARRPLAMLDALLPSVQEGAA